MLRTSAHPSLWKILDSENFPDFDFLVSQLRDRNVDSSLFGKSYGPTFPENSLLPHTCEAAFSLVLALILNQRIESIRQMAPQGLSPVARGRQPLTTNPAVSVECAVRWHGENEQVSESRAPLIDRGLRRLEMPRRKQGATDAEMIADHLENIDLTLQEISGLLRMVLRLYDRRA